jgi:DNA-binding MarR family transcriptional regulator
MSRVFDQNEATKASQDDIGSLPRLDEFKDAIELMFFAYRDFISDPDMILSKHDFGRAHHRVLHFVGCNPGMSIAELLEILQITKQSLARVLRDLIDNDYIRQQIGDSDRRKRLLFLTAKGRNLHNDLISPQIERFLSIFSEIDPNEFDMWKRVMRLIISAPNREAVDRLIVSARNETSYPGALHLMHADDESA